MLCFLAFRSGSQHLPVVFSTIAVFCALTLNFFECSRRFLIPRCSSYPVGRLLNLPCGSQRFAVALRISRRRLALGSCAQYFTSALCISQHCFFGAGSSACHYGSGFFVDGVLPVFWYPDQGPVFSTSCASLWLRFPTAVLFISSPTESPVVAQGQRVVCIGAQLDVRNVVRHQYDCMPGTICLQILCFGGTAPRALRRAENQGSIAAAAALTVSLRGFCSQPSYENSSKPAVDRLYLAAIGTALSTGSPKQVC